MRLGPSEMLILVMVVMLLFGTSRLPKLARAMKEARAEFEGGQQEPETSSSDAPAVSKPEA